MEDKIIQVSYVDFETGKSYITVPKSYRSNFSKLTLIRDEYKIYCEQIDPFYYVGCENELLDCDLELAVECLRQEINKTVINAIYNSSKVNC